MARARGANSCSPAERSVLCAAGGGGGGGGFVGGLVGGRKTMNRYK